MKEAIDLLLQLAFELRTSIQLYVAKSRSRQCNRF